MTPLSQENHIEWGLIYNYIASYFCPLVTSERVRIATTVVLRTDKRFQKITLIIFSEISDSLKLLPRPYGFDPRQLF